MRINTIAGISMGSLSLHPVQLYEAVLAGALAMALLRQWRRRRPHESIGVYLVGYGLIRFCMEFLRADSVRLVSVLSAGQIGSLLMFATGFAFLMVSRRDDRAAADLMARRNETP